VNRPNYRTLSIEKITTICQKGVRLAPLAAWKCPMLDDKMTYKCVETEYLHCFGIPHLEQSRPLVMRNCCHNDVAALRNRYLKTTDNDVTYDQSVVENILDELAQDMLAQNPGVLIPYTLEEFMSSRTGSVRKRYDAAVATMTRRKFNPLRDADISCFIKNEKYAEMKPPRAIMGRDPVFNLLYGRFTLPLEKLMAKLPCFAKGKDYFARGAWIEPYYGNYRFLANDYSKFESTQREKLLRDVELGLWKRMLHPDAYAIVELCFEIKMCKRGVTGNGVKFDFYACRGSGDMDTGLFNTIINYVACRYFEIKNMLPPKNFCVDGDDSCLAVPNHRVDYVNTFSEFGLDAKLEFVDSNAVEFCSAKFVEYASGKFVLCPDIKKLCNNLGTLINSDFEKSVGHYYYTLGYMYHVMFGALPFFDQLSQFLMGISGTKKLINLDLVRHLNPSFLDAFKMHDENLGGVRHARDVDPVRFRLGVWLAFGFSQAELASMETWFATTKLDLGGRDRRFNRQGKAKTPWTSDELLDVQTQMEISVVGCRVRILKLRNRYVGLRHRE